MLNSDKTPYSSEQNAIQAGSRLHLVANGRRQQAMFLAIHLALFAAAVVWRLLQGPFDYTLLIALLVSSGLLYFFILRIVNPFAISMTGNQLHFQWSQAFHSPAENVGRIFFDGKAMQIIFRDLQFIVPEHTAAGEQDARELLSRLKESADRTGIHLSMPGFSLGQTDELRSALNMPSTGYDDVAEELETFQRKVQLQTPLVWVTPLVISLNLLVFCAMVACGVSILNPDGNAVLPWGANFVVNTLSGEWWRLFACVFLHFGLIHILFNMWVLQDAGPLVERLTGNVSFALLYLLAGFSGSVASIYWSPDAVSAGASGAIFGVYGVLVAWYYLRQRDFSKQMFSRMMNGVLSFVVINLLIGAGSTGIGQAAHIGGLLAGCMGGLLLSHPLEVRPSWQSLVWRNLLLALGGCVLIIGTIRSLPSLEESRGYFGEIARFTTTEEQIKHKYHATRAQLTAGEIQPSDLERVLRQEILPPWIAAHNRLAEFQPSNEGQHQVIAKLLQYMALYADGWNLQAEALEKTDVHHGFTEAQKKFEEANRIGNKTE